VTNANDAPVITSNGGGASVQGNVLENTTAVTTVTATDEDLPAQALSYAIIGGADQAKFNIDASTGVLSFVAAPNFEAPADSDANNVYDVTVQVSDGSGGTDTQAISVTVTDVNDPPAITSNGAGPNAAVNVPENTTTVTTVSATDPDLPAQTLSYAIVGGADQARFSINSSTGVLSFVAAPNFEAPADSNADNVYDVTVQVSDGNGGADTQAIAVTVTDVNDPPAITSNGGTPTAYISLAENTTSVTSVTASDVDRPAQTLSYSIVGGADQAKFSIDASTGMLSFATAPNFEAPADSNADNVYDVTVQVSDGNGGTGSQTIEVAVTNVNEPPAAVNDNASGIEGNAVSGNVLANDSDPEGSTITAKLVTGPAHGTLSFKPNGSFTYTPNAHFNGSDSFTYTASDGTFSSSAATVTVTVNPLVTIPSDTPPPNNPPGGPVVPVLEPPHPVIAPPTPGSHLPPGIKPPSAEQAENHVAQLTLNGGHDGTAPRFIDMIGKQRDVFTDPAELDVRQLKLLDTLRIDSEPGSADHNLISPPVAVELAPDDDFKVNIYAEGAKFSAVFLSVGAVWWGLQASGLMAGLLASLPALRSFDVLPVLRDTEEEDELAWESDEDKARRQRREALEASSEEVPG
jgi:VCBS repeat-containing protein